MELGLFKEAVQYFSIVVRSLPKNISGWEALIRCLYKGEFYEEALLQVQAALTSSGGKPIFLYYKAAVLLAEGKMKEAVLQLEQAMERAPKLLKKFVELNPKVLQNQSVVDVVARFKRRI